MNQKRLEQAVWSALGMEEEGWVIGELCPAEMPEVVESVCQSYLKRVQAVTAIRTLRPKRGSMHTAACSTATRISFFGSAMKYQKKRLHTSRPQPVSPQQKVRHFLDRLGV